MLPPMLFIQKQLNSIILIVKFLNESMTSVTYITRRELESSLLNLLMIPHKREDFTGKKVIRHLSDFQIYVFGKISSILFILVLNLT